MVDTFGDCESRTTAHASAEPRRAVPDGGEFERDTTTFRDRLGEDHPAEPGRYHLYISRACPWAHGAALVRSLLGLEDVVSIDVLDPYREEEGWRFTPEKDGCTPDTVNGFDYLREAYVAADPGYTGRVTVPVLWDTRTDTIVNNESIEVMRDFATAFGGDDLDLYPEALRDEVDAVVEELYDPINNGVYRAGFADSQDAYDDAVEELFDALDRWDAVLADQRYLVGDGDRLTLADIRLFPTLVRFDNVYHTHFKCNRRLIREYDHLWPYLRDLYQLPGVARTVNMAHIKEHYYQTHGNLNPKGIIPVGPDLDFEASHDRDRLDGAPPDALLAEA